jgi:hypothetical protein
LALEGCELINLRILVLLYPPFELLVRQVDSMNMY